MKIETRAILKEYFKNGDQPTERDFQLLINSSVNKKDDCFFGKWVSGSNYPIGAVVYSNKSLYVLISTEKPEEDLCKEPDEQNEPPASDYCSKCDPEIDDNWCQLTFKESTSIDVLPFKPEETEAEEVKANDIRKLLEALDLKYTTNEEDEVKVPALYLNEGYDMTDIPWQEMIHIPPPIPSDKTECCTSKKKSLDSIWMIGALFQAVKNQEDQINDLKNKLDQISTLVEAEAGNGASNEQ